MKLGYEFLEEVLSSKGANSTSLGEILGISPQAISNWKNTGSIPTKRAYEISEQFALSNQELDQLLGLEPLTFCFRTKTGEELTPADVSNKTRYRAELIYERFFKDGEKISPKNIDVLKNKISHCEGDFTNIANEIRKFFEFQSYQPISGQTLNSILDQIGVKCFYLPFEALKLLDKEKNEQTAVLFTRNGYHSILINSDRTVDEAHFDETHEILHIFLEGIFEDSKETESLIDKIAGELIYPKSFLLKTFFNNEEGSKPIKDKDGLKRKFIQEAKNYKFVISPRGIARSMRDCGLTSDKSELYNFFYYKLHEFFRSDYTLTYSEIGNMNFDFSNRESVISFFNQINNKKTMLQYPLFEKLQQDLVSDRISTQDFADTFGLRPADGIVIKSQWLSATSNVQR